MYTLVNRLALGEENQMSQQILLPMSLVMQQGPYPNQSFPMHKNVLVIGRASSNDIVIDDVGVSPVSTLVSFVRGPNG
jgi:hypothetical protein